MLANIFAQAFGAAFKLDLRFRRHKWQGNQRKQERKSARKGRDRSQQFRILLGVVGSGATLTAKPHG
jgi:type II secretory pathway predicted ATPase ExeA